MPGNQGNTPNIWESREFSKILGESEGDLFFNNRKFLKCLAIWKIFQIPRYLGNSPSIQSFGKFPKSYKDTPLEFLGIWENLGNSLNSRESGEFPKTQTFGKFPRYPGIWEISHIARHLRNFPKTKAFEKFPSTQAFPQIPGILGNTPNIWESGKFSKFLENLRLVNLVNFKIIRNFQNL